MINSFFISLPRDFTGREADAGLHVRYWMHPVAEFPGRVIADFLSLLAPNLLFRDVNVLNAESNMVKDVSDL